MRELRALIWKEWSETQIFLWIAWGVFIVLPIIGMAQQRAMGTRTEFWASPWVILLGPLVGILIGVAGVCRDLRPGLEDFWRSQPVGTVRLFGVKLLVGLVVLVLACDVPLALEWWYAPEPSTTYAAFSLTPLWVACYAMGFAAGCVLRRPAHAAAVAIVGALLVYCVPIVFPPLAGFSVANLMDITLSRFGDRAVLTRAATVACGMAVLAVVMVALGLAAVRRQWRVESSKPLIYCSIGAAFLILLGSASYQLGTDLTVLDTLELKFGELAWSVQVEGTRWEATCSTIQHEGNQWVREYRSLQGEVRGDKLVAHEESPSSWREWDWSYSAEVNGVDPEVMYALEGDLEGEQVVTKLVVWDRKQPVSSARRFPLWSEPYENSSRGPAWTLYRRQNQLYVAGAHLMVFDIRDPLHPKQTHDELSNWTLWQNTDEFHPVLSLPPFPGLTGPQRLELTMAALGPGDAFDGRIWCRSFGRREGEPRLEKLRLVKLSDETAEFELVDRYRFSMIQMTMGGAWFYSMKMVNGYLYARPYQRIVEVFDVREGRPFRLVAHFAAPGVASFDVLPNGRLIAGGSGKLWLVAAPK